MCVCVAHRSCCIYCCVTHASCSCSFYDAPFICWLRILGSCTFFWRNNSRRLTFGMLITARFVVLTANVFIHHLATESCWDAHRGSVCYVMFLNPNVPQGFHTQLYTRVLTQQTPAVHTATQVQNILDVGCVPATCTKAQLSDIEGTTRQNL